jgi:hypothetical protein
MKAGLILSWTTFGYLAIVAASSAFTSDWEYAVPVGGAMLALAVLSFIVRGCQRLGRSVITWLAALFIVLLTLWLVWGLLFELEAGVWIEIVGLVLMITYLVREIWRLFGGRPNHSVQPPATGSSAPGGV